MGYARRCTTPEDISRVHRLNRNHESQTHHGDAGSQPGEKRPFVSENFSFDVVQAEPPEHSSPRWTPFHYQFVLLIAHGLARSVAESVNSTT